MAGQVAEGSTRAARQLDTDKDTGSQEEPVQRMLTASHL
jgi:hypothetical protein